VSSIQLNSTFEMGFCQHQAHKMKAEIYDAWAEKIKKNIKLAQQRFSSIFHKT